MNRKVELMRDAMISHGFTIPSSELEESDLDDFDSDDSLSPNV